MDADRFEQAFITGRVATPAGDVPVVARELTAADRWSAVKVRWGVGRMQPAVLPGLYALGRPDRSSPVLVTANYTLTFDRVRSRVGPLDAWILVLDTAGVNVWCAAGKGTFGTDELVDRIESERLAEVVDHRRLIVPQLGAPGVAAHAVKKTSGFKVVWGPVRCEDLPEFLAAGRRATAAMRRKDFSLAERVALIPMELVPALPPALGLAVVALVLPAVIGSGSGSFLEDAVAHGVPGALAVVAALLAGTVVTPLLLPWLPGRAFSCKGSVAGGSLLLALTAVLVLLGRLDGWLEAGGWVLTGTALAAFLAMNFTGSSTYTSLSGVRREMRRWVPIQVSLAVAGIALLAASRWLS